MNSRAAHHPRDEFIPCHRSGADVNALARSTAALSLQKDAVIGSQLIGIRDSR
jgi:hypothetical protein